MSAQGSLMCVGSEGWPVSSNPTEQVGTVAQIAENLNDGKVSEHTLHTVHRSLLLMELHSRRAVRVPIPNPCPKTPTMGT